MTRTANRETWRRFLIDRGIGHELAEMWAGFSRPHIRLLPVPAMETDLTAVGTSKLGGLPDLPVDMAWPVRPPFGYPREARYQHMRPERTWTPQPLDFLAQINLAEIANIGCDLAVPTKGLLSFFYDIAAEPWGFDPKDAVGAQVHYFDSDSGLERVSHPELKPTKARSVGLAASDSLPGWESLYDAAMKTLGYSHDQFHQEISKLSDDDFESMSWPGHCFGGWPRLIQHPMELECQLVTHGIYVGESEGYADPRVVDLAPGARDWQMLLQLDSDDELDRMWGDAGKLYYWCRAQDIAERRFHRSWAILQCY